MPPLPEKTLQEELWTLCGPGASRCYPLFPGYWPQSRHHSFVDNNFLCSLGAKERMVRGLLEQQFTPDLRTQYGVEKIAVSQHFHHSEKTSDLEYRKSTCTCFDLLNTLVTTKRSSRMAAIAHQLLSHLAAVTAKDTISPSQL